MRQNKKEIRRVAIIGNAFRFPSTDSKHFGQDLLDGKDLVSEVSADRWAHSNYLNPDKSHPGTAYTFAAGSLGDVAGFDASFFGISPREAAQMDPQQRLLLEMAWETLENAGIRPSAMRGSQCGVFIGLASADYSYRLAEDLAAIEASTATGNTSSIAANRLSYFFDWHGPSMAIDTACSSSLVAFHQACRAVASGEVPCAITGGISLHLHPYGFIAFSKASMLSPHGRCNTFDADGDGYVRSEGGGLFLLKDYDQAIADGNHILAVVAHSAVNTDGRKSGITVPNPQAQAALLRQAYADAGIEPEEIDYLEAHGTGTAIGDPLETSALGEALGKQRPAHSPLPIGSVKSSLGHMETASGVAGLAKALFALKQRIVPATRGIKTLNPKIRTQEWNLEVVTENRPLKAKGKLIIGINSFGFGGANAHVILESPELSKPTPASSKSPDKTLRPLIVSGRSPEALRANAQALAETLRQSPASLYDIAWQARFGRDQFEHRALLFCKDKTAAAQSLSRFAAQESSPQVHAGSAISKPSGPAFIYSGNGSQWFGMGKALLADPVFLATLRAIDQHFSQLADFSLEAELRREKDENRLALTEIAQPCLFAIQLGITEMLRAQGIQPQAVGGHSVGEVAAAWACGALSLPDAVQIIFQRSRLQGQTRGSGQMSAVGLSAAATQSLIDELSLQHICIAGINSNKGVTIAGDPAELAQFEAHLHQQGSFYKRLALDYAFHSPAMDCIEAAVLAELKNLSPGVARLPFYSTVSGGLLDGRKLDAQYWWHNIRQPVAFAAAVDAMIETGLNEFIEIGPQAVLRSYLNDGLKNAGQAGAIIATGKRKDDGPARILAACAEHMIAGGETDWSVHFPVAGRYTELPPYAWQRERHWYKSSSESLGLLEQALVHPLLGHTLRQQPDQWESVLDTGVQPMLADHVVGEATVFPGTAYVELALAVAREKFAQAEIEIEALEVHAPLLFSAGQAQKLRVSLNPADGRLSIQAREFAGNGEWARHAVARVLAEPGSRLLQQASWPGLPARAPDFSQAEQLALLQAQGLNYGPAFRAVEHGWREPGEILACLRIPQEIASDIGDYLLHPGVLDSCFQLIAQLLREHASRAEGLAFIPVHIGRIALLRNSDLPRFTRVSLRRQSPHSLLADFSLFDAQGQTIAVLEEVRFRALRLFRNQAEKITPLSNTLSAAPLARTHSLIEHEPLAAALRQLPADPGQTLYAAELSPLLDALHLSSLRETLSHLLAEHPEGLLAWHAELCARQSAILPSVDALLACLQHNALLDSQYQPTAESAEDFTASAEIWQLLLQGYPDHFPLFHSISHLQQQLRRQLSGQQESSPALPAGFSAATLARHIHGTTSQIQLAASVQTQIQTALARLAPGERLRILEIGSAPLFTRQLCRQLPADHSDYCFASPQASQAANIAELAGQFPALSFLPIQDTAQRPAGQRFDLALLVLEGLTADQASTLINFARTQLVANASLLVLAGQTDDWLQQSLLLTGQEATATPEQIRQALSAAGFALAEQLPADKSLLLAVAPEPEPLQPSTPRHWLLLTDDSAQLAAFSQQLAQALEAQGDHAHLCLSVEASLQTLQDLAQPCAGILMLAGLNPADSGALLDTQTRRCLLAAELAGACETLTSAPPLWLITQGVMSELLPAAIRPVSSHPAADAALWGFGRSLANEAPHQSIRLLDLSCTDPIRAAHQLARALSDECAESELLLGPQGERFATRLSLFSAPVTSQAEAHWKLGFSLPGQLRNLAWQAFSLPELQADEVEIQVEATGLNFRDVMYALGLLSDEALENGFAGATLGLEFAGTVLRSQSPDFSPGERVLGFGSACFANRLIAHRSAIAAIPPGTSFEAAATIPTTFFTAWYALQHLAQLEKGERVLIHGGAGGVGIAAIQIARRLGATIFATAGSDEKRDFLRQLGADHVFDSRSLAYADEILSLTGGEGVDVVLNSLAGEAINRNFQILKPFGRFLELGKRDFYENTQVGLRPFRNNLSYFGIDADQLMSERPALTRRLFGEVMNLFAQGEFHPLPWQAFEASQVIEAFRHMQQARQIGKIVVTYREGIHASAPEQKSTERLQLSTKASYLVTGGLAGFGLRSAEWLVERGARHLILISRSGPQSDEAQAALARFAAQGVSVVAEACDVTDRTALAALLKRAAASLPPLRGIVHAAAVIEDALVRNLDAAQIKRVLAPKMLGAENLHQLSRDLPLDFFVLYSSATTLFGNPGQAAYVAANSWLEALARHRRALGLPATSLLWGAIDDAGFLARNEKIKQALNSRMGGSALRAAVALDRLEAELLQQNSGTGILDLDWHALSRFLPTANATRYQDLRRIFGEAGHHDDGGKDIRRLLAELSDAELSATVADMLRQELGEILRIEPEKIATDKPVQDLGMDSLMGVELVVALEERFGVRLPVLALSESPTIDRLSERLIAQLREQESGQPESASTPSLASQVQQLAASHASESSAEAIADFARQLDAQAQAERLIHS